MIKQQIINEIIRVEGGYVDDPSDSGGETNFGITKSVARQFGYSGEMRSLSKQTAFDIYSLLYWDAVKADDLLGLSEAVTEEVVDTGINCGTGRAAKFLQRSLNVLNKSGELYPDIIADGSIGPATLFALREYLTRRDEKTLVKALNCLQGAMYIELAERREKDEKFIYGWLKNRVEL